MVWAVLPEIAGRRLQQVAGCLLTGRRSGRRRAPLRALAFCVLAASAPWRAAARAVSLARYQNDAWMIIMIASMNTGTR